MWFRAWLLRPAGMRLGMDPSGGANPRAASVQWTPRMYSHLHYTQLAKTATAQGANLTVFVAMNGDGEEWGIYGVDDMALTEVGAAPPRLQISYNRPTAQLLWNAPGFVLDTAPAVTGPWTQAVQQSPPVTIDPTNSFRFFRLRQ